MLHYFQSHVNVLFLYFSEAIPQPTVVFKRNKYHKGSIYCMAWNPLGDIIATGSNDKSIKLLRFDADNFVQEGVETELAIHNGTVRELAFIADKPGVLVSGGAGECLFSNNLHSFHL